MEPPSEDRTITALIHQNSEGDYKTGDQYKSLSAINGFSPIWDVIQQPNNEGVKSLQNCEIQSG